LGKGGEITSLFGVPVLKSNGGECGLRRGPGPSPKRTDWPLGIAGEKSRFPVAGVKRAPGTANEGGSEKFGGRLQNSRHLLRGAGKKGMVRLKKG